MKTATTRASLSVLLLCLLPALSHAATIHLHFHGVVNHIGDPVGLVGSLVELGDPVLIDLRYDTSVPDLAPLDPTIGGYYSPGSLTVNIDGLVFEHSSDVQAVQISVLHHFTPDQERFEALAPVDPGSPTTWPASLPQFTHTGLSFGLGQTTLPYTLLSSDALPTSLDLLLADFANGHIISATDDMTMYEIQFQLVPEPGTFALLGIGLAFGLSRYRASCARRKA